MRPALAQAAAMLSVMGANVFGPDDLSQSLQGKPANLIIDDLDWIVPYRPTGTERGEYKAALRILKSKDYRGRIGLKDLKRRLKYWQGRVAEVKDITADAVGPAKGKATKLIKSGEKLLETIRGEIAQREAA